MARSIHMREFESEALPALGFLELSSISRGLYLTDVVLKKAPLQVIASQPISSGKHVILYFGEVAAVQESHQAAKDLADGTLLKEILIAGVHEQLAPFLDSIWNEKHNVTAARPGESLAVIESTTLAGAILAADRALKTANISLCRMRLGQGIGGKAYFVITGRQDDVEAAADAARETLGQVESLCRVDVIASPEDLALSYF